LAPKGGLSKNAPSCFFFGSLLLAWAIFFFEFDGQKKKKTSFFPPELKFFFFNFVFRLNAEFFFPTWFTQRASARGGKKNSPRIFFTPQKTHNPRKGGGGGENVPIKKKNFGRFIPPKTTFGGEGRKKKKKTKVCLKRGIFFLNFQKKEIGPPQRELFEKFTPKKQKFFLPAHLLRGLPRMGFFPQQNLPHGKNGFFYALPGAPELKPKKKKLFFWLVFFFRSPLLYVFMAGRFSPTKPHSPNSSAPRKPKRGATFRMQILPQEKKLKKGFRGGGDGGVLAF